MLDIFISYANEDWKTASALAHELERRGRRVWWDGYPYDDSYTERSLAAREAAILVIVLWSAAARHRVLVRVTNTGK